MTQPMDFSAGVPKTAAPPPPAPQRDPARRKKLLIVLLAVVLLGGAAFLAFTAASRGDDPGKDAVETAQYCQLATQLAQVSAATGAASASGAYDGPPEKIEAAAAQMGSSLRQMQSVAPGSVREDVDVVTRALERMGTGDRSGIGTPGFAKAVERMNSHRDTTCDAGSGSGDG